jgi:vitamin B12/bleomycin/antimicrobial peptide transport system ATP-binding/permease protein
MIDPNARAFTPFSDHHKREVAARFWAVASRFWLDAGRNRAWFYSIGLAVALLLVLLVNFSINRWQSTFFNALERRDSDVALWAVTIVPLLVLAGAGVGALVVYMRETLQVFWRRYVVAKVTDRWMERDRYRAIQEQGKEPPNPEYRIADDVRMSLDPLVDFAIGFFSATFTAATFIGILWTVGGSARIPVGGGEHIVVPAFLVIAALLYAVLVTSGTFLVGRPLVGAVAKRNEAEARLRFDLTKVREHAEAVRAEGRGPQARETIETTYQDVVERSRAMVKYHTRITWFTNGNGLLIPIFALALATPKYLAGELSLGDLVSLGAAFHQVQAALSWFVDNFRQVAMWYASAGRVFDLIAATEPPEDVLTDTAPERARARAVPAE